MLFGYFITFLTCLGAGTLFYIITKTTFISWRLIRTHFMARKFGLNLDVARYGPWAVVTGATDGIGKAYVKQLAAKGLNIVLISRTKSKLETVASEIESAYNVQTKIIVADFTQGPEMYEPISDVLSGIEIGTLVNNVGMLTKPPGCLLDTDPEKIINVINCNVLSTTMMTLDVLPNMVKRGRGLVINIGSMNSLRPMPMFTVYSATKAYVDFFSRGMEIEYKSKGIIVQTVLPNLVSTNMTNDLKPNWITPSADDFVNSAMATIGLEKRTPGCLSHELQTLFLSVIPDEIYNKFWMKVLQFSRERQLKRLMKQQKLDKTE